MATLVDTIYCDGRKGGSENEHHQRRWTANSIGISIRITSADADASGTPPPSSVEIALLSASAAEESPGASDIVQRHRLRCLAELKAWPFAVGRKPSRPCGRRTPLQAAKQGRCTSDFRRAAAAVGLDRSTVHDSGRLMAASATARKKLGTECSRCHANASTTLNCWALRSAQ